MSRRTEAMGKLADGFPRVSGDEPETRARNSTLVVFSPRERG